MDTRRCVKCGCPAVDHQPLRYVLKAWLLHLPEKIKHAYHVAERAAFAWTYRG